MKTLELCIVNVHLDTLTSTLLLLIFAGLNFRDFQKIAKLKTREN